jgi:hypothetical protein
MLSCFLDFKQVNKYSPYLYCTIGQMFIFILSNLFLLVPMGFWQPPQPPLACDWVGIGERETFTLKCFEWPLWLEKQYICDPNSIIARYVRYAYCWLTVSEGKIIINSQHNSTRTFFSFKKSLAHMFTLPLNASGIIHGLLINVSFSKT